VNYTASQKHNFGFSYSRRLNRPNFDALNPFEISVDAYSFITGNPYLTPAYTHNVQLSHTFAQSLMTRISYSSTTDMIMRVPIEDATNQRYGLTYGNFGKAQNYSAMMNYRKTLLKICTANLTAQGSYSISTSDYVNKNIM